MKDNKHRIFEHGECISEDVLLAYVNNKLNAKEKHVVEKHMLGCDMCADALEGILLMKHPEQLKGIVESLNKKIRGAGEERKPIILWMDTRVRVAIAAGLALLVGFFFLFNNSLNEDKTVSDDLKQKGEAADSTSMSPDESAKTDSLSNFHQIATKGKEQDSKSDLKHLEKSGKVSNANGNGGPGFSNSHANDPPKDSEKNGASGTAGDALKSTTFKRELKKDETAPPPQDLQQQNGEGFNDITTLDRSKAADDKRVVSQTEKKPESTEKDKDGKDANGIVTGKVTNISTVTANEPVQTYESNEKSAQYYNDIKKDAPKKEEKEKIVSKEESRKDKKKSTAYAETQKHPDEKNDKGGRDNSEKTTLPQSTVVTGGSSGTVSPNPNMVPQNNRTEQEITLSKNKQVNDEEDSYSKTDTLKFRAAMMDSVSKTELLSGEKRYADKDYAGAIIVFSKTLESKPADREALYKLGDSYLQLNKPELAIAQFDKLITMGKGAYYDAARYDKSQALIRQNKNAEAKKLLMEIESTSTEYKSRAKVELDKIK